MFKVGDWVIIKDTPDNVVYLSSSLGGRYKVNVPYKVVKLGTVTAYLDDGRLSCYFHRLELVPNGKHLRVCRKIEEMYAKRKQLGYKF